MQKASSVASEDLPSISIVIPTYNCAQTLDQCLKSIAYQDYPKEKIEIIIVDGGSIDQTVEVAKSFNAKVLISRRDQQNQERRRALGLMEAEGEIVAYIDSDNMLPHKNWFRSMVRPFFDDEKIVATQPLRYTYEKSHSLLNRYFALWGVNDPLAYYLDRRDRLSWAENSWIHAGDAVDRGYYYCVRFRPENMPTLGANGFLAKRKILLNAKVNPSEFFHIDVNYDLVKLGFDTYGIVKEDIIHLTGNTFFSFLRKRMMYMIQYYLNDRLMRRYKLYSPTQDKRKLILFIFNSFTLLKPTYDSIRGYKKIHDTAWFLHPLMCLCFLFIYGFPVLEKNLKFFIDNSAKKTDRSPIR